MVAATLSLFEERSAIDKGQMIAGNYRLIEQIGSGGMGAVWHAYDERLHRAVAIKQLLAQPDQSAVEADAARRRAMREARIAARLSHPNAIAIFDVVQHNGDPCLIMEFLRSRSLADLLEEHGTLPVHEIAAIGAQVANALAAAHRAGVVHRDIKPANVLVDESGIAKITDFGISRATGDVTVTQTGMMSGTPAYLAPEIAKGHDPTPASDVFSLGATLYAAVEGQPPFGTNSNPLALLHLVAAGNINPPKQAGPLTELLLSLLQEKADDRPSMAQAAALLTTIARDSALTTPAVQRSWAAVPPMPPTQVANPTMVEQPGNALHKSARQSPKSRRATLLGLLTAVVVVALGVLAVNQFSLGDKDNSNTNSSVNPPPGSATPSTTSSPATNSNQIGWRDAGLLVVKYYSNAGNQQNRADAFAMLTDNAKQMMGGEAEFSTYWNQYPNASARSARATPNADKSVNITLTVTYAPDKVEQRTVRVVKVGDKLLIDSDAR